VRTPERRASRRGLSGRPSARHGGLLVDDRRARALAGVIFVLASVVAGLAWSFSSPLGSSPDDDYHQASLWCPPPIEESGCDLVVDDAGDVVGVVVPALVAQAPCFAFATDDAATCQTEIAEGLVPTSRVDRGGYPGPYYRFMNVFVGEDVTRSILAMRAFNVVLAVVLLAAAALLSSRNTRHVLPLAVLATFVPLGMFITASVNPSAWALAGLAAYWMALHTLLTTRDSRVAVATAALSVLAAGIASVSRADAGAYVVVLTLAIGVLNLRRLLVSPPRLAAPAVAVVIGLWSYLTSNQADVFAANTDANDTRPFWDLLIKNVFELPGLIAGVFGHWGLGWLDTRLAGATWASVMFVASGLVMVGLGAVTVRKLGALLVVGGALLVLPLYILQGAGDMVGENVQPRYFLPLVTALVGIAVLGETGPVRLSGVQRAVVWALLVGANSVALHSNIRRYVTGQDVWLFNLGQGAEWWWSFGPSPMEVWAIGSAAFAVVALAILLVDGGPPVAQSEDVDARRVPSPSHRADPLE